jgi:type VI protein secretion system component Hcp
MKMQVRGLQQKVLSLLLLFFLLIQCKAALGAYKIYIRIEGQEGPVMVEGREGTLEGYEFLCHLSAQLDGTGRPGGELKIERLSLAIPAGPLSTFFARAVTTGRPIREVIFHFDGTGPEGMDEFYRITLRDVLVTSMETASSPGKYPILEEIDIAYYWMQQEAFLPDKEPVSPPPDPIKRLRYIPGDTNGDLEVDLTDVIRILDYLYRGEFINCPLAGDVNTDNNLDISDAIYLLIFQYGSQGRPPPSPYPSCGEIPWGMSFPCYSSMCNL